MRIRHTAGILCALILGLSTLCADEMIARDGWEVRVTPRGFTIDKDGVKLSSGSSCGIVAGPQWNPILGSDEFAGAVRAGQIVKKEDRQLGVTMEKDKSRGVLTFEIIDAEKLKITWAVDTDVPEIADDTVWFIGLDQEDYALGEARFGNGKTVTLPCRAPEAEVRKSLWRLTPDVREMSITGRRGVLTIAGTYFHLFDARFHGYFLPELQTFCLRSAPVPAGGRAEFVISFQPMIQLTPELVHPVEDAAFFLDCGDHLLPLAKGENHLKFEGIAADAASEVTAVVTGGDGRERSYSGSGESMSIEFCGGDVSFRAAAVRNGKTLGGCGPLAVFADGARPMLERAKEMLEDAGRNYPAAALDAVSREYGRLAELCRSNPATAEQLSQREAECTALLRRLSCFAAAAKLGRQDVAAVALPSTARLMPGTEIILPEEAVTLHAAGGQTLFFQLVLLPLGLEKGKIAVTAPRMEGIEFDEAKLFEVLPVVVGPRSYPDMLEERGEFDFDREAVNVFVAAKVPKGAPAGRHELSVEFKPEGETSSSFTLSIPVEIYPFDLPEVPEMLVSGSWIPVCFEEYLPRATAEERARFLDYVAGHKVMLNNAMQHPRELDSFDWSLTDVQMRMAKAGGRVNLGSLPWIEWLERFYYAIQPEAKYRSAAAYYAMVADRIAANAAAVAAAGVGRERTFFYYDEIGTGQQEVSEMLRKLKERTGAGLMLCFDKPQYGVEYIDYYRELPDWLIFCGRYFGDDRFREMFDSLRAEGKKIGWYFNTDYPPLPSFNVIEAPAGLQKALSLYMIREKISCNLLWGLNAWRRDEVNEKAPFPYVLESGGNGYLFYPARDRKHFASSLRFELLLEGIETAQYFELLAALAAEHPDSAAAAGARELLKLECLGPIHDSAATPEMLRDLERRAAELIVSLKQEK